MPDKEELEERITEMIDADHENTIDVKKAMCYNKDKKEEHCYAECS